MTSAKPNAITSQPADETAVRTLYEQMMDGWKKGRGEAFAAPFAEDADFPRPRHLTY